MFIVFSSFLLLAHFFLNIPHCGYPAKHSKFIDDLVLQGVLIRGVFLLCQYPSWVPTRRERYSLGKPWSPSLISQGLKNFIYFLNFSKLAWHLAYVIKATFSLLPLLSFSCSNRGTATLSQYVQIKSNRGTLTLWCIVLYRVSLLDYIAPGIGKNLGEYLLLFRSQLLWDKDPGCSRRRCRKEAHLCAQHGLLQQGRTLPYPRHTAPAHSVPGYQRRQPPLLHILHGAFSKHGDKKENQIFLICKEIPKGSVAKSYMTSGLIY